ncbi:hypothetical protein HDV02_001160 [Globomyces sp. JEL0801]|nr:hypothetical protein HDV02_001160 [Globomyces sp. JEL0801]
MNHAIREGRYKHSQEIFKLIKCKYSKEIDIHMLISRLTSFIKAGKIDLATQQLQEIKSHPDSHKIFKKCLPDNSSFDISPLAVAYNIFIAEFCDHNLPHVAQRYLQELKNHDLKPTIHSYLPFISYAIKTADWKYALQTANNCRLDSIAIPMKCSTDMLKVSAKKNQSIQDTASKFVSETDHLYPTTQAYYSIMTYHTRKAVKNDFHATAAESIYSVIPVDDFINELMINMFQSRGESDKVDAIRGLELFNFKISNADALF